MAAELSTDEQAADERAARMKEVREARLSKNSAMEAEKKSTQQNCQRRVSSRSSRTVSKQTATEEESLSPARASSKPPRRGSKEGNNEEDSLSPASPMSPTKREPSQLARRPSKEDIIEVNQLAKEIMQLMASNGSEEELPKKIVPDAKQPLHKQNAKNAGYTVENEGIAATAVAAVAADAEEDAFLWQPETLKLRLRSLPRRSDD